VADVSALGVEEGQILAGKYRVERVLGVGGMGVVVAAHHLELHERVALKLMLPELAGQPGAVARFMREARAAVKIKSEHVARILDVGSLENGAPFMVMEYLNGSDLAAWLRSSGPLVVEQAVDFLLQAGEAVAEAHALGIVHRDLKPANLFVIQRPDGQHSIKVLDFGISKVSDPAMAGGATTKTFALMGSPLYMSPEQMESARSVDARSDIWALGVILYELLTGTWPFNGETIPQLVLQVAKAAPTPLLSRRPDAPEGLEKVLMRCLEKDPNRRYQTVAELAGALVELAPQRGRISVDRIAGTLTTAAMLTRGPSTMLGSGQLPLPHATDPTPTASSFGSTSSRRHPRKIALGLSLLAVPAIGFAGLLFAHHLRSERSMTTAAALSVSTRLFPAVAAKSEEARTSPLPPESEPPPASAPSSEPEVPTPEVQPVRPPLEKPSLAAAPKSALATRASKPEATKAPPPNCSPNFYFDSQGAKHFKRECF
jgi:eukaryotic-like serine/threonine-protein kinase